MSDRRGVTNKDILKAVHTSTGVTITDGMITRSTVRDAAAKQMEQQERIAEQQEENADRRHRETLFQLGRQRQSLNALNANQRETQRQIGDMRSDMNAGMNEMQSAMQSSAEAAAQYVASRVDSFHDDYLQIEWQKWVDTDDGKFFTQEWMPVAYTLMSNINQYGTMFNNAVHADVNRLKDNYSKLQAEMIRRHSNEFDVGEQPVEPKFEPSVQPETTGSTFDEPVWVTIPMLAFALFTALSYVVAYPLSSADFSMAFAVSATVGSVAAIVTLIVEWVNKVRRHGGKTDKRADNTQLKREVDDFLERHEQWDKEMAEWNSRKRQLEFVVKDWTSAEYERIIPYPVVFAMDHVHHEKWEPEPYAAKSMAEEVRDALDSAIHKHPKPNQLPQLIAPNVVCSAEYYPPCMTETRKTVDRIAVMMADTFKVNVERPVE